MQNLILLHGAIGASDQLLPIAQSLGTSYNVFTPDFSGHGGKPYGSKGFSIQQFAEDLLHFMDDQQITTANLFGYSMGGYVAMYFAKHHPERVGRIVTLATKFYWDKDTAAREVKMLDPEKIEAKLPAFAASLAKRHAPNDWKEVLQHTTGMLQSLGENSTLKMEDYTAITTPSLVMIGDRDKMITLEETVDVYKALPAAQMAMLPNTPHPIEQVNTEMLSWFIRTFLA